MNRVQASSLSLLLLLTCNFAGRASGQAAPKNSGYLHVSGAKIYYEVCGAGPNVVPLHDGLLHSNTGDGAWDALCKKYHAVRYDRRGYGRSEPPKAQYSASEDLFVLLTHLKVRPAIVAGNSSGGALAIDFALAHPEMVEGLVLLGPVVQGMDTTPISMNAPSRTWRHLRKGI